MTRTWDVSARRLEPELMDDPLLDAARHDQALSGLRRINALSRCAAALWPPIAALARQSSRQTITILDVAAGGGDIAVALARRAQRRRLPLELHACDLSPAALAHAARQAAAAGVRLRLFRWDALRDATPGQFDVVLCSLFLHHLCDDDAVRLLRRLRETARRLLLVSDLRRARLGLLAAAVGARLLSRSPIVHSDGPQSVRAAFTLAEVRALAREAGLHGARISPRWPQRMLLNWSPP